MRVLLTILIEMVFFSVLAISILYIVSDVFGVVHIGRNFGGWLVGFFVIGVPLSLLVSVLGFFTLGYPRYRGYLWVSNLEVVIVALAFLVIYRSQI